MAGLRTIAIAADHGGYALKETIVGFLDGLEAYQVMDLGTDSDASVDYPEYGIACGEKVASGEADLGIVICGTGIGISIAANKVPGIRCALCTDTHMAEMSRAHNDANMLALGGRTTDMLTAIQIVETWLATNFEGDRHQRRIDKIAAYERGERTNS